MPVAVDDDVAFAAQVLFCEVFTPLSEFVVRSHRVVYASASGSAALKLSRSSTWKALM